MFYIHPELLLSDSAFFAVIDVVVLTDLLKLTTLHLTVLYPVLDLCSLTISAVLLVVPVA